VLLSVAAAIEFLGALILARGVLLAVWIVVRYRSVPDARLEVAEGVVAALSFKVAATLLKAMMLASWQAIGFFAVILALRTVLGRLFAWEAVRVRSLAASSSR